MTIQGAVRTIYVGHLAERLTDDGTLHADRCVYCEAISALPIKDQLRMVIDAGALVRAA